MIGCSTSSAISMAFSMLPASAHASAALAMARQPSRGAVASQHVRLKRCFGHSGILGGVPFDTTSASLRAEVEQIESNPMAVLAAV
jgi:hypothetical protein